MTANGSTSRHANIQVANTDRPLLIDNSLDHYYAQVWLLVMSVIVFGLYVAWDLRLLHVAYEVDRSYLTLVIGSVFVVSSAHAIWYILCFSWRILLAKRVLGGHVSLDEIRAVYREERHMRTALLNLYPSHFLGSFIEDINNTAPAKHVTGDTDELAIVEIYADGLRGPVELGWYIVDLEIRMGLIGTIVGFILIFGSLSGNTVPSTDEIQQLLISMSSGMGTALYTTLSGLVAASFLGFQYMILSREVENLIGLLIRIRSLNANSRHA